MSSIKLDKWVATSGNVQKTPVIQVVQKVVDTHHSTVYSDTNSVGWESPLSQSISLHNRDSKVLVCLDFRAGCEYWQLAGTLTRNNQVIDEATGYNRSRRTPVTWVDNNYEYVPASSALYSEYSSYQCNRLMYLDTPTFLDSSNTVTYGFIMVSYLGNTITMPNPSYGLMTRQNDARYYDSAICTMTLMEVQQ